MTLEKSLILLREFSKKSSVEISLSTTSRALSSDIQITPLKFQKSGLGSKPDASVISWNVPVIAKPRRIGETRDWLAQWPWLDHATLLAPPAFPAFSIQLDRPRRGDQFQTFAKLVYDLPPHIFPSFITHPMRGRAIGPISVSD